MEELFFLVGMGRMSGIEVFKAELIRIKGRTSHCGFAGGSGDATL